MMYRYTLYHFVLRNALSDNTVEHLNKEHIGTGLLSLVVQWNL